MKRRRNITRHNHPHQAKETGEEVHAKSQVKVVSDLTAVIEFSICTAKKATYAGLRFVPHSLPPAHLI